MWKRSQIPLVCGDCALVRGMVDVVDRQIQLIFVPLDPAAIFTAAIREQPSQLYVVFLVERQHSIVQHIRRGGGTVPILPKR